MPCPGQVLPVTRNRSVDARSSGRGSGFDWLIEAVDADAISYPPAVLHQDAASRIHRIASRPEASRGPPRAPHLDFATAFPGNGTMFFFDDNLDHSHLPQTTPRIVAGDGSEAPLGLRRDTSSRGPAAGRHFPAEPGAPLIASSTKSNDQAHVHCPTHLPAKIHRLGESAELADPDLLEPVQWGPAGTYGCVSTRDRSRFAARRDTRPTTLIPPPNKRAAVGSGTGAAECATPESLVEKGAPSGILASAHSG
jgi:hypothetical protein